MSEDVATRYADYNRTKEPGYSGMGTTLSAKRLLQFACTMRATLEEVMTEENYDRMGQFAGRGGSTPGSQPPSSGTACPGMLSPASAPASSSSLRARPAAQWRAEAETRATRREWRPPSMSHWSIAAC